MLPHHIASPPDNQLIVNLNRVQREYVSAACALDRDYNEDTRAAWLAAEQAVTDAVRALARQPRENPV